MTLAFVAELDGELIARIRAGEESAFEQLFLRYYRELAVYASRIDRVGGAAEEIVQEVFFRIWMHRERLLLTESLSGYLYAVTRNVSLNRLARTQTEDRWRAEAQAEALEPPGDAGSADVMVRETEMAIAIDRAIAKLPPRCREAFLLRRQRHMSYAEIAQAMQTSPKTVEIQIGKALRLLRASLSEWL
jgi:RNA polymerase sigma-70 factor (ECF subfamily)